MNNKSERDDIEATLASGEIIRADLTNQINILTEALATLDRTQHLLEAELQLIGRD